MFEVLTVVTKKITVFQTVMLCSLINTYQHLGGNCCLHLQDGRLILYLTSQYCAVWEKTAASIFRMED